MTSQPTHWADIVLCYLHSTSVIIHEAALVYPPLGPMIQPAVDLQRVEYLTACLQATKASLEGYLSLGLIHMNMSAILSFSHATQVLYKLSVLDYPGWDLSIVRATADVLWYFEQSERELEKADEEVRLEGGEQNSIFIKAAEALRSTIPIWKAGLDSALARAADNHPVLPNDVTSGFEAMDTSWLSFPDDIWFQGAFAQMGNN